ncbi:MAG: hypothetical protein I8H75_05380 [Myxococcaceae bacterium]|nr:hypothetical protein [Myxococcaceae bacterium]MBH2006751.1 hypothetical protein [Myxococcaceae bacterium]
MVRIIKHTGETLPAWTPRSRVIKGAAYKEQKEIESLFKAAVETKSQIAKEGLTQASQSRQRGLSDGIQAGQNEVSQFAFSIFVERNHHCEDLKEPLKQIIDEIALKILGRPLTLAAHQQDELRDKAIQKIKAQHQLKLLASSPEAILRLTVPTFVDFDLRLDLSPDQVLVLTEVGSSTLTLDR